MDQETRENLARVSEVLLDSISEYRSIKDTLSEQELDQVTKAYDSIENGMYWLKDFAGMTDEEI